MQIHYAAGVLLLPLVILAWTHRAQLTRIALIAGAILALETLIPFALGVLQAPPVEVPPADTPPPASVISLQGVTLGLNMISGLGVANSEIPAEASDLLAPVPSPAALWLLLVPLTIYSCWTLIRQRHPLAGPLIGWAGLPVLIFTPSWLAAAPHYYAASLPALMILTGLGASALGIRWRITLPPSSGSESVLV